MITLPAASLVSRSFLRRIKNSEFNFAEVDFGEIDFGEMDITFVYVYDKAITLFFFLWDYGYPTEMIRENDINHEFIVSEEF